jgi:predicted dehydrogenase
VYDSYDDLLNDPSIEVLDIVVPADGRVNLIGKACARKTVRGILTQAPLDMDFREAVNLAKMCQEAGIILSVNQTMRYDQSVRAAKTLLQNGVIGEPVFATIEMRGIPRWMPWGRVLGMDTLHRISSHHMDCFRHWFGDPEGVYCSIQRTRFPGLSCAYILEYANGLRCVGIDDPWMGVSKEVWPTGSYLRWRIEGFNGLAIGDIGWRHDSFTTPSTIKFGSKGDPAFHEPTWAESWLPDGFIATMAQLLIALETGMEPAISAADNLKTMELVEAAYVSTQRFASINMGDFEVPTNPVATDVTKPGVFSQLFSKSPFTEKSRNFTPRAQQALALARKEADRFHHNFVGTEHLLLGLIALGQGVAVNVLKKLGLNLENVREAVEKAVPTGRYEKMIGKIPYTPRVKRVLALAAMQAKKLNHTYVGTEHILLGLLQEGDGVAARVLKDFSVDTEKTRLEILKELDPNFGK